MKFNLLTVLEIQHISKEGKVLWSAHNLRNTFHIDGELFMLQAAFVGGPANVYIPSNYYFGLDARDAITVDDTMSTISSTEPSGSGYFRQAVSSTDQFQVAIGSTGHYVATSPIVTFTATGGGWGPVYNLFLTDKSDNTGYLIASVPLGSSLSVAAGEGVHMRMGLTLGYCPALPTV